MNKAQKAVFDALVECGRETSKRRGLKGDDATGVYTFLGEAPITTIIEKLSKKLDELGYEIRPKEVANDFLDELTEV